MGARRLGADVRRGWCGRRFVLAVGPALVIGCSAEGELEETGEAQPEELVPYECTNPQPLTCPENDCYEAAVGADNDDSSTATPLGEDMPIDAIICSADTREYDYFAVAAAPGCALSATATFTFGYDSPAGDVYVYVERDGTSIIQDTNSDLDGISQIEIVSRSAEPYHLYLTNGASTDVEYRLSHTVDCAAISCPTNDRNEPNDRLVEASGGSAPLTQVGDVYGAIACEGESDWYWHPGANAGSACAPQAIVRFDASLEAPLTVDLRISDVSDLEETVDASTPGVLVVTATDNVPSSAYVEVRPTGAEQPLYSIELLCD